MTSPRFITAVILAGFVWSWHGAAMADYGAGMAAFNSGDFATAFAQWEVEARNGNSKAQHGLAVLYETGRGVPSVDAKKAADYYQAAADQDYAPAITNLARLYEDGRGVTRDLDRAMVLWRRAADLGNPTALYNLAAHYAEGVAVDRDDAEAAKYFQAAAELGLSDAQYAMARITRDGSGVPIDEAASLEWLRKAAAAGHPRARMDLAALSHILPDADEAATAPGVDPGDEASDAETAEPVVADGAATSTQELPDASGSTDVETATGEAVVPPDAQSVIAEDPPAEVAADSAAAPTSDQGQAGALEQTGEMASDGAPTDAGDEARYLVSLNASDRVYRLWLGQSGQEKDAKSQWAKFQQQYPGVLGKLELDLRRYYLGEAKGSIYRVFAGPFDEQAKAEAACRMVVDQDGGQFCRVVVN